MCSVCAAPGPRAAVKTTSRHDVISAGGGLGGADSCMGELAHGATVTGSTAGAQSCAGRASPALLLLAGGAVRLEFLRAFRVDETSQQEAGASWKVEALRVKLEEWERSTGGQKAIVFMRERVACRLLGEELGCEWIVADGGGPGIADDGGDAFERAATPAASATASTASGAPLRSRAMSAACDAPRIP